MKKFLSTVVIGTALVAGSVSSVFAGQAALALQFVGQGLNSGDSGVVAKLAAKDWRQSQNGFSVNKKAIVMLRNSRGNDRTIDPSTIARAAAIKNFSGSFELSTPVKLYIYRGNQGPDKGKVILALKKHNDRNLSKGKVALIRNCSIGNRGVSCDGNVRDIGPND